MYFKIHSQNRLPLPICEDFPQCTPAATGSGAIDFLPDPGNRKDFPSPAVSMRLTLLRRHVINARFAQRDRE
jgi:hypothetical protein